MRSSADWAQKSPDSDTAAASWPVVQGAVGVAFRERVVGGRVPAARKFLDGAHVDDAVMEIALEGWHVAAQEAAVLPNGVAAEGRSVACHVALQEGEGAGFGFDQGHLGLAHARQEAGFRMVLAVPVVHGGKLLVAGVNCQGRPRRHFAQVGIGD